MKAKIGAVLACALLAACGGGDDDGAEATTTEAPEADATTSTTADGPEGLDGGVDDFDPGPVSFRFVHLAPDFGEVDVYAFTSQGLVEEYLLEEDVAFGDVLDDLRPPTDGKLVIFPAGTTDLSTITNDDVVADLSTATSQDQGTARTAVLAPDDDGDDGVQVSDYWELPAAALEGTAANALPPAIDGRGLLVVTSAGAPDSVYVAQPGAGACLTPLAPNTGNVAVGGTTVLAFDVDPGAVDLALHSFDAQDFDCTQEPVLTATAEVQAGQRTLVLVHDDGSGGLATANLTLASQG